MNLSVKCLRCGAAWGEECRKKGRHVPCPDCGTLVFVPPEPPPISTADGAGESGAAPPVPSEDSTGDSGQPAPEPPRAATPNAAPTADGNTPPGTPAPPPPKTKPCFACGESIRAAALKCRYCGHVAGAPISGGEGSSNPFAWAGLACAFLAWPAVGVAFLALYGSLAPSLGVGLAVAAAGAALGCAGVGYWFLTRPRAKGLGASLAAVVLSAFAIAVFLMYGAFADQVVDALPADSPLTPVLRQALQGAGEGEGAAMFPMKCFGCGHRFQAEPRRVIAAQLGAIGTIYGGAGDIDALLDQVEREGAPGTMECPECRRRLARPVLEDMLPGEPGETPLEGLEGLIGPQEQAKEP